MKNIPSILLKHYLKRNPNPLDRLRRYNFLSRFVWIQPILEEIKPEIFPEETPEVVDTEIEQTPTEEFHLNGLLYRQYRCKCRNPLGCKIPQETIAEDREAKYCKECRFPAILAPKTEIRGKRGRYCIESLLNRRGLGRLYEGFEISKKQPVIIKEYLIPDRCFNQQEAKARKQTFEQLAGVNLADGRVHNFRLIEPWDAIADELEERCYLITTGKLNAGLTMREYLAENGPIHAIAILKILYQVLQSLESLHGQKFRLPSGQIMTGVSHGNINLDTLIIRPNLNIKSPQKSAKDTQESINKFSLLETEFFIYLSDLSLWEYLFNPPPLESVTPTVTDDLAALGRLAFYLLLGREINPETGQPFNPENDKLWPGDVNLEVKRYILNLLGIEASFANAEIARNAIPKLPPEMLLINPSPEITSEKDKKAKFYRTLWMIVAGLGLVALALFIWSLLGKTTSRNVPENNWLMGSIADISAIPPGKYIYTAEKNGTWTYTLRQKNLVSKGKTLEEVLQEYQPKLQLDYQPQILPEDVITKVRSRESEFAITTLTDNLPGDLEDKEIAFDGLLFFVNFSYVQRDKGLPQALKGQITFEQLRQLYTGQITNWQQLGGPDLPVKLYIPTEIEAIKIFEQKVLQNERYIADFRKLVEKPESPIIRISTFETLRKIIQDFESNGIGGIAFGTASKVFGQCSVYPLAIAVVDNKNQKNPIQALIQNDGIPISPATDLCNQKGNYSLNIPLFKTKTYPLAYDVSVIYPRDNTRPRIAVKFVEVLRSREGQHLLNKTGLVPLEPLP